MRELLKEYFMFTRSQRNGVFFMLIILFLLLIAPYAVPYIVKPQAMDEEYLAFINDINKYNEGSLISGDVADDVNEFAHHLSADASVASYELFQFNPNDISENQWVQLGVSTRVAKTIKNYLSKGGKFRKKEDLQKIYGISGSDYERLSAYILIDEEPKVLYSAAPSIVAAEPSTSTQKKEISSPRNAPGFKVDVNIADSADLTRVRGIGPAFAARIVKYRDNLGGFRDPDQLKEVYGIDSVVFERIAPQLVIDTHHLQSLNINIASKEELSRHPYINFQLAQNIVNYRKQHGSYSTLQDLMKLHLVNPELYRKIEPYLEVQ